MTLVAWQCAATSAFYLASQLILLLAVLGHPSYTPQRWQGTLVMYALVLVAYILNTYRGKLLPKFEVVVLILHVFGFLIILTVQTYLTPKKNSSGDVLRLFINVGGWPSQGLAFFVGLVGSIFGFLGVDGAAHLAEEVENASTVVPRSMLLSVLINGAAGVGLLVSLLFCMGSVMDVINSVLAGELPFAAAFVAATGSESGAIGLVSSATPIICSIHLAHSES